MLSLNKASGHKYRTIVLTHVFVNDPTSGYGTFIEWMLQDAGVFQPTAGTLQGPLFSL